jgi:hypothetical protein
VQRLLDTRIAVTEDERSPRPDVVEVAPLLLAERRGELLMIV